MNKSKTLTGIYANIGKIIRKRRTEMDLTLEELAFRCGRDWSYLCQIELAKSIPSIETLALICEQLGIKMSELFEENATKAKVVAKADKDLFAAKITFLLRNTKTKDKKTALAVLKKLFQK